MDPDYIDELADMADPTSLWKTAWFDLSGLHPDKRAQLDAGVALRRHAEHVRRVRALLDTGNSLVITPLPHDGVRTSIVPTSSTEKHGLLKDLLLEARNWWRLPTPEEAGEGKVVTLHNVDGLDVVAWMKKVDAL